MTGLSLNPNIVTGVGDCPEQQKKCSGCGRCLPFSAFNRNRTRRDGYQHYCRDCQRTADKRIKPKQQRVKPETAPERKVCGHCRQERHWTEFSNYARRPDGLASTCKSCVSEANKAYRERVRYVGAADIAGETLRECIDYRALPSPSSGDYHWRWIGPKRIEGHGTKRVERLVAEAIGMFLPAGARFWCADETPWPCVNPSHAISAGELPQASGDDIWDDPGDAEAASEQGFNIVKWESGENMGRALRRLDAPVAPDFRDPGTRFLLDHGYDAYGQPLRRGRERR